MDSDRSLISAFFELALKTNCLSDSIWIFVDLNEEIKKKLKHQSTKRKNIKIFLHENSRFEDLNGTICDYNARIKPFKTYYFIESEISFQNFRSILLKDTFIFAPKSSLANLDAISLNEKKSYSFAFIIDARPFERNITTTPIFMLIKGIKNKGPVKDLLLSHNKFFERDDEDKSLKNEVSAKEMFLTINLEYFKLMSKMVEELEEFYICNAKGIMYEIYELIDILHNHYIQKNNQEFIIFTREFLITGVLYRIKEILGKYRENSLEIFDILEDFKFFLNSFKIESILENVIRNQLSSGLMVTILYDYFVNSNINNLKGFLNPNLELRIMEVQEYPVFFEIINSGYQDHVKKLLGKKKFVKCLRKLVKISVEAPNEENALDLIRKEILIMGLDGINETDFKIHKKENIYSILPKVNCLVTMLKAIIPKRFLILRKYNQDIKFAGKTLIGGEIVFKFHFIQKFLINNNTSHEFKNDEPRQPLKIIEKNIIIDRRGIVLENKLIAEDIPQDVTHMHSEDNIPSDFPYRHLSYIQLINLSEIIFDEVILNFNMEKVKISKRRLKNDILEIAKSILFAALTHELSHAIRLRFGSKKRYSIRTPVKMHQEAGLYIDRAIYGEEVKTAGINSRNFTINISEKILNAVELTREEALTIFPSGSEREMKGGVCEYIDFEDQDNFEYICTGRISERVPVKIREFSL